MIIFCLIRCQGTWTMWFQLPVNDNWIGTFKRDSVFSARFAVTAHVVST